MRNRRRQRRSNPGSYTYKMPGKTPEAYLQDMLAEGSVVVTKTRNPLAPEQEITEIYAKKSPSVKLRYAESQDYTRPTRFEVSSKYQYTPLADTASASAAVNVFRQTVKEVGGTDDTLTLFGGLAVLGVGLYLVSSIASRTPTTEVASVQR